MRRNPFSYESWKDMPKPVGASVHIQRRTKNPNRKMCQMRSVVVELDPTDHAVVFHIRRNFRFINSQMLCQSGFQAAAVRMASGRAAAAGLSATAPANQIPNPDAQSLAGLNVIRRHLVGIRKQKYTRSSRSFVGFVQAVQRTCDEPPQHGFQISEPRSECRLAGPAMSGAVGGQRGCGMLDENGTSRFRWLEPRRSSLEGFRARDLFFRLRSWAGLRKSLRRKGRCGRAFAPASTTAAPPAAPLPFFSIAIAGGSGWLRIGLGGGRLIRGIWNFAQRENRSRLFTFLRPGCGRLSAGCRAGNRQGETQPRERFFGFLFPIGTAKALSGDCVPAPRFLVVLGLLFDCGELPRHHSVASTVEKLGKLCVCVGAIFRFADPRLDLPPISHGAAL